MKLYLFILAWIYNTLDNINSRMDAEIQAAEKRKHLMSSKYSFIIEEMNRIHETMERRIREEPLPPLV